MKIPLKLLHFDNNSRAYSLFLNWIYIQNYSLRKRISDFQKIYWLVPSNFLWWFRVQSLSLQVFVQRNLFWEKVLRQLVKRGGDFDAGNVGSPHGKILNKSNSPQFSPKQPCRQNITRIETSITKWAPCTGTLFKINLWLLVSSLAIINLCGFVKIKMIHIVTSVSGAGTKIRSHLDSHL